MSGLHTQTQEMPKQVIARFDDLFTEHGIAIAGDNDHLMLHIAEHHSINRLRFPAKP